MSLPGKLLKWLWPSERRSAKRKATGALSAYYWNGAEPRPRRVKNLSAEGMYLVTEERWYPNTMIAMTLTRTDTAAAAAPGSVKVMARVVRSESDGVGFTFVHPTKSGLSRAGNGEDGEVNRRTLVRFLNGLPKGAKARIRSPRFSSVSW